MSLQNLTHMIHWVLLVQCRVPATVRCLSHPSAHIRTFSASVLRAILHAGSILPHVKKVNISGIHSTAFHHLNDDIVVDWQADIGKCLTLEAHSRLAIGMPIQYLQTTADELGCALSIWHDLSLNLKALPIGLKVTWKVENLLKTLLNFTKSWKRRRVIWSDFLLLF